MNTKKHTPQKEMAQKLEEIRTLEGEKRAMLRELLSEVLRDDCHVLAQRSNMGGTDSCWLSVV